MQNIIKTSNEIGNLKNFIRLTQKAGQTQYLSNNGQFTVFAPSDSAFSKLSPEKIESLLNDKDRLLTVIKTHIIAKKIMSPSLNSLKKIKTINGKELVISTTKGLQINDSNITKSDIECTNGVIHVIDKVFSLK